MHSAASPRWNSSAPLVSSRRLPSASTRSASAGAQAIQEIGVASCQFTSVEMVLLCSRAGLGDCEEAFGGRLFQPDMVFDLQQQRFDRNAVVGGHGECRRVGKESRRRQPRPSPASLPRGRLFACRRAESQARHRQPEHAQNSSHQ